MRPILKFDAGFLDKYFCIKKAVRSLHCLRFHLLGFLAAPEAIKEEFCFSFLYYWHFKGS